MAKCSEAQKRAIKKYKKKAIRRVCVEMNVNTDADILSHIQTLPNVAGYIKRLIREDISK